MKNTIKGIINGSIAAGLLLAAGSAGCGSSTTSSDVAYEDDYAGDYYYPADVAYSGVYAGGWGYYGIYAATPAGTGSRPRCSTAAAQHRRRRVISIDGGHISVDGGHVIVSVDAGRAVDGGGKGTGSTTVREAVGQAIREAALGDVVCAGQATVTPKTGTTICGVSASGVNIVFSGCQLSGGGTIDGTVDVQITRSASDTTCDSSTTITLRVHLHHHQPDLHRHRWSEDRDSQRDEHVDAHLLVWPIADHRQHPDQRRDSAVRQRWLDDLRPDVHRDL